ncbi:sugar transferase [Phocaeicola coprocola]|jgi:lipopolysaccharide/colanic/teichoic acid biosynthesis glycosyltransferase|uniref:sugar transferase n=1 Tax=Phocaeicola coprocola TaxID=310298 RepID=UPI0032C02BA4
MDEIRVASRKSIDSLSVGTYRQGVASPAESRTKRVLDFVASIIGMVVFSPLFLIIYIAIKHEDGGNAIFKQERVGYRGKIFTLYKFRSMAVTSESDGKPVLCSGKDDKRLTRVGRFLREHHLDELPQLWNVCKGEMSFVGPRPERKFFVDKIKAINPDYELLYRLRPGLFSAATLYNGYTDTMEKMLERLRMDLDYLHNRSLWLDTKIIFLTVFSILSGKKF